MYDVSEFPHFSVLMLVIHVREVSILRADGKGVVPASYEVHGSRSIAASLWGQQKRRESQYSEKHFASILHLQKVHSISITNGAIKKYKV